MKISIENLGAKASAVLAVVALVTGAFTVAHQKYALAQDLNSLATTIRDAQVAEYNDKIDELDLQIGTLRTKEAQGTITAEERLTLSVLIDRRARYTETLRRLYETK